MSLVVVASALPFRAVSVPWEAVRAHGWVITNLLAGSLVGAWLGASWATRLNPVRLRRVIAVLLVAIAGLLLFTHNPSASRPPVVTGLTLIVVGVLAGLVIGAVAAFLGVAGGGLLIPTIVLLFGVDVKLAGSLSLCVSLPTMLVGFARYSRDRSFAVLGLNREFVAWMAAGSLGGTFVGGRLLGLVASYRPSTKPGAAPACVRSEGLAASLTNPLTYKSSAGLCCQHGIGSTMGSRATPARLETSWATGRLGASTRAPPGRCQGRSGLCPRKTRR